MLSKVLVVNKYHFISGGAERYFLAVMESLRKRGIEAIPFSINYSKTLETPYRKYFIDPVVKSSEAKIQNQNPGLKEQALIAREAIWNVRAGEAVKRIIREERPDVAYFLNFNNHIGPSAIEACHSMNIPVVMRMSDFNLVCASNMYYRDGGPCTDCRRGLHHAVLHRCVHGSLVKSAVALAANSYHRLRGVYRHVKAFVAPTEFMKRDLMALGFPERIIHQINTFAEPLPKAAPDLVHPYILFMGRFAPYKGIDAAIRAFARMRDKRGVVLKLVGDEGDADARRVKALASSLGGEGIQFLPFERNKAKLLELNQKALFTLVPSEFYENLPNTLLESFSCGRPVISTRLGSLPDIVKEYEYGLLYNYGDIDDFAAKMEWMITHPAEREAMGGKAYRAIVEDYNEEQHMAKLLGVFEEVLPGSRNPSVELSAV